MGATQRGPETRGTRTPSHSAVLGQRARKRPRRCKPPTHRPPPESGNRCATKVARNRIAMHGGYASSDSDLNRGARALLISANPTRAPPSKLAAPRLQMPLTPAGGSYPHTSWRAVAADIFSRPYGQCHMASPPVLRIPFELTRHGHRHQRHPSASSLNLVAVWTTGN